jgi:hypothetical protein
MCKAGISNMCAITNVFVTEYFKYVKILEAYSLYVISIHVP